ncbi:class I SAM-dependent methyltransferase [Streptomyces sp. NPDC001073]
MSQTTWDERAKRDGLYAVLSGRWTPAECAAVDQSQRKALVEALPRLRGRTVLDLGCGIGRLSRWLAVEAQTVVGIDSSVQMVARARREVTAKNTTFLGGRAEDLPFRNAVFDVVLTTAVLQHILLDDAYQRACAQAARVLRPEGTLICFEGLGSNDQTATQPSATATMRRPLSAYTHALGPAVKLQQVQAVSCVKDEYTVMTWIRIGEEPG